jgi:nitrogen fixation protein FixH
MSAPSKPHELTGKHVLLCLVGFFGVVFAVNAVMVKAATSTFGGIEVSSSYKAGLMFKQDVAAAEQQEALRWQVNGKLARNNTGQTVLDVSVRDATGAPVAGLTAQARLAHPAAARLDQVVTLNRTSPGQYRGEAQAQPGQWELIIDFYRDDTRMFHSQSRVSLR